MQISLLLKGMAMGLAEAIPGVSGGTIAFITGIYARLLNAIGNVLGPRVISAWKRDGLAAAWKAADGFFILQLGVGMVVGLGIAVVSITELIEAYPPIVWAFFFGLIISSAIYVAKQVDKWNILNFSLLAIGAVIAFVLTTINPMNGSDNLLLVFLAGSVAISALILPGISGSFILLILGMYTVVLGAVRQLLDGSLDGLAIVVVFALGCLVGLALFSRVLSYTFKTYPDRTLAILTGFMVGSLNKLWPWRNALTYRENSAGEKVALLEETVLPGNYLEGDPFVVAVVVALVAGLAIVFAVDYLTPQKDEMDVLEAEL
ncbi:DUF368 domain-containing protein [Lewinella sp. 4G2]|uniref:DUF368 domain-containing protein n=1 Tax=Lewinella sp. 4G2 TaxID=1803372 RepID=UPI0007B4B74E|nr:DUF368 domain-containing protein [Lewinella sp. 4G2]OAV45505.1 hypothetical protein A3850_013850 [Lewinella sp. 4G2]